MANLQGGKFNKFTVIKNDDAVKYLVPVQKYALTDIETSIVEGRLKDGRSVLNKYLVINVDEPYADEIIEILKRNGHWG